MGQRSAILIVGILLVAAGFYVVVDVRPWPPLIWLDLVVSVLVVVVDMGGILLFSRTRTSFPRIIPSLGILGLAPFFYTVFALGGIVAAHLIPVEFKFALVYQAVLLFCLWIGVWTAGMANRHALRVQRAEAVSLSGLDQIRAAFHRGTTHVAVLETVLSGVGQDWRRLADDVRYLSAVQSPEAQGLEQSILKEIGRFLDLAGSGAELVSQARIPGLTASLDALKEQVRLRKAVRALDDSQGVLP